MRWSDFRIGWRLLVQEPFYSAVSVLGLAAGFCACFLLLVFVRYSLSYDAQVPDGGRVMVLKSRKNTLPSPMWIEQGPATLGRAARQSGLAIAAALHLDTSSVRVRDTTQELRLALAEPDIEQVLGLRAEAGDLHAALTRPDSLALTHSAAVRLFGRADGALNQTVHIGGAAFLVVALLPDPPPNTTIAYGAMGALDGNGWADPEARKGTLAGDWWSRLYLRLAPGASADALLKVLQGAADRSRPPAELSPRERRQVGDRKVLELRLGALHDAYFDRDVRDSFSVGPRGDKSQVLGLAAVAALILLLAAVNYVNLATVRILRRRREIGVRKMLGAGRARIVRQFLAESVLVALLASVLGLLLAWLLLPLFAEAVDRDLGGAPTLATVLAALLIGVGTGLAAGAYPAWVALRLRGGAALSGREGEEHRGGFWLRRGLTVLQFAVAMGLGAVTVTIAWQNAHMARLGPGFDPAPLLVIDLPGPAQTVDGQPNSRHQAFRAALARQPYVAALSMSNEAVGRQTLHYRDFQRQGGDTVALVGKQVSPSYFETYDLHAVAGRLYDSHRDGDTVAIVVLNWTAARVLGFDSPQQAVGQFIRSGSGKGAFRIIGIAPEIRHQSLREAPQPAIYMLDHADAVTTVRVAGDPAVARAGIESLYRAYFPDDMIEIDGAADLYAQNYAEGRQLFVLLLASTVIAMAIAAFGIYVLAAYNVRRRTREIVLRKLYGAGRADIARLVGGEFLALVGAGAVVGLPPAAIVNAHYLAGFVERAPIGPWALAAAFAAALLVAVLATLRHGWAATAMAPAPALRG
jgi:predicted permease